MPKEQQENNLRESSEPALVRDIKWYVTYGWKRGNRKYVIVAISLIIGYMGWDAFLSFRPKPATSPNATSASPREAFQPKNNRATSDGTIELTIGENPDRDAVEWLGYDEAKAYYHPVTGETLKWYSEDEKGTIAIYDHDGYSVENGQKLKPVTDKAIHRFEEQQNEKKLSAQAGLDSAGAAADETQREQRYLQLRQKYFVMNNVKFSQEKRIALTMVETGSDFGWSSIDRGTQDVLSQSLGSEGFGVTSSHFRKPFFADGRIAELVSGNGTILARLRPEGIADIFLIGTVTSTISIPKSKQLEGTKTCKLKISATVFDPSGRLMAQEVFSAVGLGFSDVTAQEKAILGTVPKVVDMIKSIK